MSLPKTYFGVEIHCAWPTASLMPGAVRPDYECWEAWLPPGARVADFTLRGIKEQIKAAMV